jgi:hypothetical protein
MLVVLTSKLHKLIAGTACCEPSALLSKVQNKPQLEARIGDATINLIFVCERDSLIERRVRGWRLHVEDTPDLIESIPSVLFTMSMLYCGTHQPKGFPVRASKLHMRSTATKIATNPFKVNRFRDVAFSVYEEAVTLLQFRRAPL